MYYILTFKIFNKTWLYIIEINNYEGVIFVILFKNKV